MRRVLLLLLTVSFFPSSGCETLQKKHDNPVMVAAPRRVDHMKSNETETGYAGKKPKEDEGTDIELVRSTLTKKNNPWDDWKDDTTIFNSQVAATVNGAPILNGDVLDRFSGKLISVREQMQKIAGDPKLQQPGQPIPTPDDYEKMRYQIIQAGIFQHIQQKLLVERLKGGLKTEQLKLMDNHVDEQFAKEIERLKVQLKVTNRTELELALNKMGTTLQNVKDNFALEQLSMECIAIKSEKPNPIERPDLVEYYQAHGDEFAVAAKVKWQQIQISIETPSTEANKKAARAKLEQAIAELKRGLPFEQVAEQYSDGSTAKDGGVRDWMEAGNLADTKLEKKLFSMPVGQLSDIHEGPDSLSVVRVIERQSAGRKPFEDVQQVIRKKMVDVQNANRMNKFVKDLFAHAFIETQYSLPQFASDE